jgi:serine/threonine protein kinase
LPPNTKSLANWALELRPLFGWHATFSKQVYLGPDSGANGRSAHGYAALKVYTRERVDQEEFDVYQALSKGNPSHPGYPHVRAALDMFTIPRPGGDHKCLVQKPMWDSLKDLLGRNPTHRFPEKLLKACLAQVLLALEYLHSECKLVHTGRLATRNFMLVDLTKLKISRPTTYSSR